MKITPKEVEKFLKNIPQNIKAILIYGPNQGLTCLRVNELKKDYEIVTEYSYEVIKDSHHKLIDSFNSIGLFAKKTTQKRAIIIEINGLSINKSYSDFLEQCNHDGLFIFKASELSTDSTLRRCFEKHLNCAAVASYMDDKNSISIIARQFFSTHKIMISINALDTLCEYLPQGDRLLILNELEKVYLSNAHKNKIEESDIFNLYMQQGDISIDKLCYQSSLKQIKNIDYVIDNLLNEGHNIITLVRSLIRHFERLHQVKSLISSKMDEQSALDTLTPPLFFKKATDFKLSLNLWSEDDLQRYINKLIMLELSIKKNSTISIIYFKRIISSIL